ncbi:MATE family efflux transporter [Enterococcus saccharolyticus]|uniref:MATE family efflux transporter n=1 Tax=Candidatus Enterococcus willemsii TaxID=1857215 RepID=A0ABQ6Z2G9_9ENTE|nr:MULTISPECIES: MATE family efflux transporter [Enterococcus]KAF1305531.1 MATE family efflux transporter [Enterococcus sp. CU12B]MCD5002711.1 MATE family efflux transporter [Enterococcus saccharolyticus]
MTRKRFFNASDSELFFLSWPIFIELFLRVVIGNINVWMISHYSEPAVAAVGASNQLLNLSVFIYGFITVGTQIIIAQLLGAEKHKEIKGVIQTALFGSFAIGLLISFVFLFFSTPLLHFMNLDAELIAIGKSYLQIYGGSLFLSAITAVVIAVLRTHSFTRPALLVPMAASILAVIGNYFALYSPFGLPNFGVTGLAFASVFGNTIGLIIALFLLNRHIGFSIFSIRLKKVSLPVLKSILTYGLPSSGESLSYQGAQVVVTMIVASLGSSVLIAKSYITAISQFVYLVAAAMSQGNQIMIGRNVGAGQFDRASKRGMRTVIIGVGVTLFICVITYLFIEPIMGIFTTNQEVIAISKNVFLVEIVLESVRAINMILVGALNASGDVKFPLICSLLVLWAISLPFSYTLAIVAKMGLLGVWVAYAIDEALRSILMIRRWRSGIWQTKSVIQTDNQAETVQI